jgi:hypothetical protein
LRLWQVSTKDEKGWRASLENVHSGEIIGFTDLDDLLAFVKRKTGSPDKKSKDE